jgi:hypothetical protein
MSEFDDLEDEEEAIHETDSDRRQTLMSSEQDDDLQELKAGTLWEYFEKDFHSGKESISDRKDSPGCDLPAHSGSVGTSGNPKDMSSQGKRKRSEEDDPESLSTSWAVPRTHLTASHPRTEISTTKKLTTTTSKPASLGIGKFVQAEIDLRKKESLGMASIKGGGRTLGTRTSTAGSDKNTAQKSLNTLQWICLVCTLWVHILEIISHR